MRKKRMVITNETTAPAATERTLSSIKAGTNGSYVSTAASPCTVVVRVAVDMPLTAAKKGYSV